MYINNNITYIYINNVLFINFYLIHFLYTYDSLYKLYKVNNNFNMYLSNVNYYLLSIIINTIYHINMFNID